MSTEKKKDIVIGILYAFNIGVICLLLVRVKIIDNDKAPLLIAFFYPALIVVNLILALILRLVKNNFYKSVIRGVLFLLVLFIPILMIVSMM